MVILFLALGCLVVGFLLYLPFGLWFRRRRRRGTSVGTEVRYTRSGYLLGTALIAAFFGGLVVRETAPESWFASRIQGDGGMLRWGVCVLVVSSIAEMMLRRADVVLREERPRPDMSSTSASEAPAKLRRRWKIAVVRGVPVFIHGSLPIGGLLVAAFAGSGLPGTATYCLAFVALIVVHELGHVLAARALGLSVFAITISGLGGSCVTQVPRGVKDTFVLFSGGLAAQAVLLVLTSAAVATVGDPASAAGKSLVATFTVVNLVVAVMNIVPGKVRDDLSNDGAILWELAFHCFGERPHPLARQHAASPVFPPETRLVTIPGMVPSGFQVGIEILNDDATPMEFVIAALERHLKLDHEAAIAAMISIHPRGGLLLSLVDRAQADDVARDITQAARAHGLPLVCRAAEAPSA